MIPVSLQKNLLQGELADLALYQTLRRRATGDFAETLDAFIQTEIGHVAFWRDRFKLNLDAPSFGGRLRNLALAAAIRLFGQGVGYVLLEAVEAHGVKKYLDLWNRVQDPELREGLRSVLTDELLHEDEAATGGERTVSADTVRNVFLGFNDGSVEILGAVSGLVAALSRPELVAVSATTVSVAGALSMAAGAFMSTHAEREIRAQDKKKSAFLDRTYAEETTASPWKAAAIVGGGYLVGAAVPVAPFLFGATTARWSIVLSGTLILAVSALLAFLSGMDLKRRVALNAAIITVAVLVSYAIGSWLDASV